MPDTVIVPRGALHIMTPASAQRIGAALQVGTAAFSRTRDIVAANLNEALDRIEDPAKLMRLVVVEIEEALIALRGSVAQLTAERDALGGRIEACALTAQGWADKAELALTRDREDLAKAALMERERASAAGDVLRAELDAIDEALPAAEADIARLEARLGEARTLQRAVARRQHASRPRHAARREHDLRHAFARFEALERRADEADARGAAVPRLEQDFIDLCARDAIDADLATLKAGRVRLAQN